MGYIRNAECINRESVSIVIVSKTKSYFYSLVLTQILHKALENIFLLFYTFFNLRWLKAVGFIFGFISLWIPCFWLNALLLE
jgi:hypothetical protein